MEEILRVMVSEVANRSEYGLESIRFYGDNSERALRLCRFGSECQRTDARHFSLQRHEDGHPLVGQPVQGSSGFLLSSLPSCTHHLVGGCAIGAGCRFFHPTGPEAKRAARELDVFPKRGHSYAFLAGTQVVTRRKRFSGANAPLRGAAFRRFVVEELGVADDVVDVGGGGRAGATGGVAWQLCNFKGAQRCYIVDPRPADFRVAEDTFRRSPTSKLRSNDDGIVTPVEPKRPPQILERVDDRSLSDWINSPLMLSAKAIVGLHPDSATLTIVKLALRLDLSFAVVPCCVCFRSVPELDKNNVRSYEQLLDYLQGLHPGIERKALPFPGRNVALYRRHTTTEAQRPSSSVVLMSTPETPTIDSAIQTH